MNSQNIVFETLIEKMENIRCPFSSRYIRSNDYQIKQMYANDIENIRYTLNVEETELFSRYSSQPVCVIYRESIGDSIAMLVIIQDEELFAATFTIDRFEEIHWRLNRFTRIGTWDRIDEGIGEELMRLSNKFLDYLCETPFYRLSYVTGSLKIKKTKSKQ